MEATILKTISNIGKLMYTKMLFHIRLQLFLFSCAHNIVPNFSPLYDWFKPSSKILDHEIISTVILLPSAVSFKKGCCQLQAKVCARSTG